MNTQRALPLLVAVHFASGCVTGGGLTNGGGGLPQKATVLAEAPLTYVEGVASQPVPVVEAQLLGLESKARLVVDTTAARTTLTPEAARSQSAPKIAMGTMTVAAEVAPDPGLAAAGLGGRVNPANILARGYAVLDLSSSKVLLVDGNADSLKSWLAARYPGVTFANAPVAQGGNTSNYLIQSALEDKAPLSTLISTSGARTAFPADYAGTQGRGDTSSGNERAGRTLTIAGRSIGPVTITTIDGTVEQGAQPILGVEVLRQLIVVLPADVRDGVFIGQ